jgi:hypothetical protein
VSLKKKKFNEIKQTMRFKKSKELYEKARADIAIAKAKARQKDIDNIERKNKNG